MDPGAHEQMQPNAAKYNQYRQYGIAAMNNVELAVRIFERAGVRWVFGVPSGPVLPLIEALRPSSVEFVLTATETSAGFMAEAVGRLTGVPGVCVSTVGPGTTNLATGVGGAFLDRSPVVAITCDYATRQMGRRTQMWIDHQALFAPLTKASLRVEEGRVASAFADAFRIAASEPPGPVHLDFPEDVARASAVEDAAAPPAPEPAPPPPPELAVEVGALLRGARRPLVAVGLAFTRARRPRELLRFIETQGVPFVTTLHAKGFLPESHPASLGVMGRARRTDVQRVIDEADLILAVGFDPVEIDYDEWAKAAPVAHLSPDPVQPDERAHIVYAARGGVDGILAALAEVPPAPNAWDPAEWEAHRARFRRALRPASNGMAAHHVIDELRALLPPDAIIAYDVGAHTHQIASQWTTDEPHTALATNGWSSMGYGMPAAYAAKLARPERIVVGVVGDGCFQMTAGELATARRLGLPAPVVVLNDGWLSLMQIKQERLAYPSSGAFLGEQVDAPSHYFGVPVRAVRTPEEFRHAMGWALALDGPSVVEAYVDPAPYAQTVFDV